MKKYSEFSKEILWALFASVVFAVGYNVFIDPSGVVLGGVTGLATVFNRLFPFLPVGVYILLFNLPLIFASYKVFGARFILRSVIGTLFSSAALDLFSFLPFHIYDPLFGALFGGASVGLALGLMYAHGFNTGGADLVVFLLRKKWENLSSGLIVLILDAAVVLFSAAVYRDFSTVAYSALAIFAETRTLDRVLSGFDRGQLVFIFSNQYDEIARDVSKVLRRGTTAIDTTGWFTGRRGRALLCAVRKKEVYRLKRIIKEHDPNAFSVFTDAFSISGNGFDRKQ